MYLVLGDLLSQLVKLALESIPLGLMDQEVKPGDRFRYGKLGKRVPKLPGLSFGNPISAIVLDHRDLFSLPTTIILRVSLQERSPIPSSPRVLVRPSRAAVNS